MPGVTVCNANGPAEIDAPVRRLQALKINRCPGSRSGTAEDCRRLATLFGLLGEWDRAMDMLGQPVKIETASGRRDTLADVFHSPGEIFPAL